MDKNNILDFDTDASKKDVLQKDKSTDDIDDITSNLDSLDSNIEDTNSLDLDIESSELGSLDLSIEDTDSLDLGISNTSNFDIDFSIDNSEIDTELQYEINILNSQYIEDAFTAYLNLKDFNCKYWSSNACKVTDSQENRIKEYGNYCLDKFETYSNYMYVLSKTTVSVTDRILIENLLVMITVLELIKDKFNKELRNKSGQLQIYVNAINQVYLSLSSTMSISDAKDATENVMLVIDKIKELLGDDDIITYVSNSLTVGNFSLNKDNDPSTALTNIIKSKYNEYMNNFAQLKEFELKKSLNVLSEIQTYIDDVQSELSTLNLVSNEQSNFYEQLDSGEILENELSPIDRLFTVYKDIKFLDNGKQLITCSCGAQPECDMIKFLSFNVNRSRNSKINVDSDNNYFDVAKRIIINDNYDPISQKNMIYTNLISNNRNKHYNVIATLREVPGTINNEIRYYLNPTNEMPSNVSNKPPFFDDHMAQYSSVVEYHSYKCDDCGKNIIPSGADMEMFSSMHVINICNSNMLYTRDRVSLLGYNSNNKIHNIVKEDVREFVIYSSDYLSQQYLNYKSNQTPKISNSMADSDYEQKICKCFIDSCIPKYNDSNIPSNAHDDANELRNAWNRFTNNYKDFTERMTEYTFFKSNPGRSLKTPGYYPQINMLKLMLSRYKEDISERILMNFAFNKRCNSQIYYGLIFRKHSNNIKAAMFTVNSFVFDNNGNKVYNLMQSGSNPIAPDNNEHLAQMIDKIQSNCRDIIEYCGDSEQYSSVNKLAVAEQLTVDDVNGMMDIFYMISDTIDDIVNNNPVLSSFYSDYHKPNERVGTSNLIVLFNMEYSYDLLRAAVVKDDMRVPYKVNAVNVDIFDYLTPNVNWEFHYGNLLAFILIEFHKSAFENLLTVDSYSSNPLSDKIQKTLKCAKENGINARKYSKQMREILSQNIIAECYSVDKKDSLYRMCDTSLLMQYPVSVIKNESQNIFNKIMNVYDPVYYSVLFESDQSTALSKLTALLVSNDVSSSIDETLNEDIVSSILTDIVDWYVPLYYDYKKLKLNSNGKFGGYWIVDKNFTMREPASWVKEIIDVDNIDSKVNI